jgi:hypothetical protein
MKKTAYHPYLFGLFPVLFLFSRNMGQGEMRYSDIAVPSMVVLCLAFIFSMFFSALARDRRKGAILASIFLLFVLSYGHGYSAINLFMHLKHRVLLTISAAGFFMACYFIIRTKRDLLKTTIILNVIAASMLIVPLSNVALCIVNCRIQDRNCRAVKYDETLRVTAPVTVTPDIYYIIMDSYIADRTLKEVYDYDNRDFTDFLKKKGFVISAGSRSNYASTFLSLASSLNMEYVNHLAWVIGRKNDLRIVYNMIKENSLNNFLRAKGYRTLHFGMWWQPGRIERSLGFDLLRDKCFNPFSLILMEKSILNIVYDYYFASVLKRVTYNTFEAVAKVPGLNVPTFTFAYFYGMHAPYVFGAKGEDIDPYEAVENAKHHERLEKLYLGQLAFYNNRMKRLIEDILSGSRIPPIIVLQSDHGLQFSECSQDNFKACIQQRMRIFSAYYLPGNGAAMVYDSITPVNTFRLILKRYFNVEIDLLEDRCYYSDRKMPFIFTDVSDPVAQ